MLRKKCPSCAQSIEAKILDRYSDTEGLQCPYCAKELEISFTYSMIGYIIFGLCAGIILGKITNLSGIWIGIACGIGAPLLGRYIELLFPFRIKAPPY